MTAPNLRNPTAITGKTDLTSNLNTSATDILTNPTNSDKVYKINAIFASNTNASVDGVVSIGVYDQSNLTYLAYNLDVPAKSTQIISTKETYFYLEEGISIRAFRSSSTNMAVTIGYEELS